MADHSSPPTQLAAVLLDAVEQPLAVLDGEGRVINANLAFDLLFRPVDRGSLRLADVVEKGGGRLEGAQADGTVFHMEARVVPFAEGDQPRFFLSVRQVSEPGSEGFSAYLFQQAVESANDAIIITTPGLDEPHPAILYVNPAFTRMTGYSFEEVKGKTPRLLQGPRTSRALLDRLRRDISGSGFFFGETINYRKDGSEYAVEWRISPLRGANGETTHWVAIQRDVTERVIQEDRIKGLNETLERRVKERTDELEATNRELETFNYSVSHDLRAPLRTILGFGSALSEDYGDVLGLDGKDYIDRMNKAARRMDELITAILGLSRLARAKMARAEVDLSAIARTAGREQGKPYPDVRLEVEGGLRANADEGLARAVIGNLLENAFKFSHRQAQPVVRVCAETREGKTYLVVQDNGIGFDPKYTSRIFESFERLHTDAEYPGTGIGLATVLRAVRRHGGEVLAESQPGEGAKFLVWFGEPEAAEE